MKKLNIALIGYGKMGKEIEKIALERGHFVSLKIDENNSSDLNSENLKNVDVCIEFTNPKSVIQNIKTCFKNNVPIVSGTTGWINELQNIIDLCKNTNKTFFYASNYSIGVNIFFEINKKLANLMNFQNEYEIEITEIHHTQKLDSPSGTAITIANQIIENIDRKSAWKESQKVDSNEIKTTALRQENVTGTHIINYISEIDEIEIKHVANNRKGFAIGAVLAAEFIAGKNGYFTMSDMLK